MTAFPEFAIPADVGQERVFPISTPAPLHLSQRLCCSAPLGSASQCEKIYVAGTRAFTRERKSSYELGAGDF
jgi:hypothetical protein